MPDNCHEEEDRLGDGDENDERVVQMIRIEATHLRLKKAQSNLRVLQGSLPLLQADLNCRPLAPESGALWE